MVVKVISLVLILAVVCSQVFAAPPANPESETWGDFMARLNPNVRNNILQQISDNGLTTPSPDATRGPKPEGGRADEDGNAWWGGWGGYGGWGGWGYPGWGWGMWGKK